MKNPMLFLALCLTAGFAVHVGFAIGTYIAPSKEPRVQLYICEADKNGGTENCEKLPDSKKKQ